MCLLVIMRIHNEIIWSLFSFLKVCRSNLMSLFHFLKWKETVSFETCAFRMTITGASHRQDAIILTHKILFSKYGARKCLSLNSYIYDRWQRRKKYYNMTHLYVFPKLFDELWSGYEESGKKILYLYSTQVVWTSV